MPKQTSGKAQEKSDEPFAPILDAIDFDAFASTNQSMLDAMAHWNTTTMNGVLKFNAEVAKFIRHRLDEDQAFREKLQACSSLPESIDLMSAFYRRAFAEFSDEFGALMKIGTETGAEAIQTAEDDARTVAQEITART